MKLTLNLPSFTMTKGKVPKSSGGGGVARRFRRNFRKILLWGGVGLAFFVLFAWLSLPTRAIAWRISHEAKSRGYIIDVEDVSLSPFGGVTLENVQWTFEPSRAGQIPTKFVLDEVDVDISVLSLLVGNIDVEAEAILDEGTVTARYYRGGDESEIGVEIADLPLYGVPKAAQALNAPLRGILAIKVELTMPEHKFGDANGIIELTCAACTVGGEGEKLFVPGSSALKSGVIIPQIDMGTLSGRLTVEEGIAKTDGPIETKSDDVWIEMSGTMTLLDPFQKSRFDMVLKFNLSEKLQDESEPMRFMIQTANPKTKLDEPEKGLGFRLEGPVSKPRFIGIKSKSRRQSRLDKRAQQRARDERRRAKRPSKPKPRDDSKDKKPKDDKPKVDELPEAKPVERPPPSEPVVEPPPTEPAAVEPSSDDNRYEDGARAEEPPSEEPPSEETPSEESPDNSGEEPAPAPEGSEEQGEGGAEQAADDGVEGGGGEGG